MVSRDIPQFFNSFYLCILQVLLQEPMLSTGKALAQSSWTMWPVLALSPPSPPAHPTQLEPTTVSMLKMLVSLAPQLSLPVHHVCVAMIYTMIITSNCSYSYMCQSSMKVY